MKKRLHDPKAGIAILVALIIISLVEVIFRAVVLLLCTAVVPAYITIVEGMVEGWLGTFCLVCV